MEATKKRKNRNLLPWFSALMLLLFTATFLYSPISMVLDERLKQEKHTDYVEEVAKYSDEYLDAEFQKAVDYNNSLNGDPVQDPFVLGSGKALPQNYLEVLNVDGVMGYIEIPKIAVYLPIYHSVSEEVLEKGIGHIQESFMPVGGENTHSVLSGHSGLPHATMFSDLTSLEKGDRFYLHILNRTLCYEVDAIHTVLPGEFKGLLDPEPGKDYCSLITCTPYGINTHRLLVRGTRIPLTEEEEANIQDEIAAETNNEYSAMGKLIKRIAIVLAIVVLFVLMNVPDWVKRRKKGKEGAQVEKA